MEGGLSKLVALLGRWYILCHDLKRSQEGSIVLTCFHHRFVPLTSLFLLVELYFTVLGSQVSLFFFGGREGWLSLQVFLLFFLPFGSIHF